MLSKVQLKSIAKELSPAIYDVLTPNARYCAENYGIDTYEDYVEQVFEGNDAIETQLYAYFVDACEQLFDYPVYDLEPDTYYKVLQMLDATIQDAVITGIEQAFN